MKKLPFLLGRLPTRFQWTVHNLVGHPLSEVLYQLGAHRWSELVHEATAPGTYASHSLDGSK